MTLDLDRYEGGRGLGVQRWVAMVREPQGRGCDDDDDAQVGI